MEIKELKFDENGLIPAIISDALTNEVLMVAYMNRESLKISINEGKTCFWSRSRNELWRKGETSGNTQQIISIKTDCDKDALLIAVNADGPACHTGKKTCFFNDIMGGGESDFSLIKLFNLIKDRKVNPKSGSYTTYLFGKGKDKILKKLGEENAEFIRAFFISNNDELAGEAADCIYHLITALEYRGVSFGKVLDILAERHK